MGCINSKKSEVSKTQSISRQGGNKEENENKIDLLFKAKRQNVFTAGLTNDAQDAFKPKYISKNEQQKYTIRNILFQYFTLYDNYNDYFKTIHR
jgi:hypothetical protein